MSDELRERWVAAQNRVRESLDEPIGRAQAVANRAASWFAVRVWRRFLRHNGFLLAAGLSYQALFAFFAVVYIAFAGVGLWLGASAQAISATIDFINSYLPGLIQDEGGIFTRDQVTAVASQNGGVLTTTGLVAVIVLMWTAIGFVTFSRRAVRDIFSLPFDERGYVRLKARDLVTAVAFGGALVIGGLVGGAGTWALRLIFSLAGWSTASVFFQLGAGAGSLVISFAINTAALAALYRLLAGTRLPWRSTLPGAAVAGSGVTLLQFGGGVLVAYSPSNPLLATFSVFIFLLLWFRLVGIVILVGAAWTAETAEREGLADRLLSVRERAELEQTAVRVAGEVAVREANKSLADAAWWQRPARRARLRRALQGLAAIEATLEQNTVGQGAERQGTDKQHAERQGAEKQGAEKQGADAAESDRRPPAGTVMR